MNREQLSDAIGRLDEELVGSVMMPRRRPRWQIAVAIAACIALVIGAVTVWPLISSDGQHPDVEPPQGNVTTAPSGIGGTEEGLTTDTTVGSDPEPSDTATEGNPSDSTTDGADVEPSVKPTAKPSMQRPTVGTKGTTVMKNPNGFTTVTTTTAPTTATKATKNTGGGVRGTKTTIRKGTTTRGDQIDPAVKQVAYPTYPEMAQRPADPFGAGYDAWDESVEKQMAMLEGQTGGMSGFYNSTIPTFLVGEEGKNRAYSPLNVYLALSMLAETTEGESRRQILDLLGVSGMSALRKKSHALWNGVYLDDGAAVCRLANSLWLSDDARWQYDEDTIARLEKNYYAAVYEGDMGSEAYNKAFRDWMSLQSGGLLDNWLGSLRFSRYTTFSLASTITMKTKWNRKFVETQTDIFYTVNGEKSCKYLIDQMNDSLWQGENFTAVSRDLDNRQYQMWFFLPDTDVSVDELIWDEQMLGLMQGDASDVTETCETIHMSIPQFDVACNQELSSGLTHLGITDVFIGKKCDFGGLIQSGATPVRVDEIKHGVRVKIDEEGLVAAAGTVIVPTGSGKPQEPIEFKLNRPFVFAITGPGNTVLFAGVVENP